MLCSPINSNSANALAQAIADAFMTGFIQEGG
jgi:flavoprotein